MNPRLSLRPAALVAALAMLAFGGGDVRAADPAPPAQGTAPPSQGAAPPAQGAATPAAPASTPATPEVRDPGVNAATGKGTPLHFEPTEKTRADFEVSFPTDI
ncbi:MAG TPA: hypothetical protein VMT92_03320 [Steroidobacteraceae bacterium]|nr:hypothetical protein [Steroidobacteraceae bacterium]